MNKILFSLITTALGLVLAFAALGFSVPRGGVRNPGSFVSDDRIKAAFLDRVISLDDIPPGFYAWQAGTPSESLYAAVPAAGEAAGSESVYRNFKFASGGGAWIKFLITPDSQIVFTSGGLVSSGSSSNIDVLETISNKIRTTINESKKIKLSSGIDGSSDNVGAAIYNAVMDRMSVGPARRFLEEPSLAQVSSAQKSAAAGASIRDIHIAGKMRGAYLETFIPGTFDRARAAFVVKHSGIIARVFIMSEKKTQFMAGGVRDESFLGYFSGLLIGDVSTANAVLIKESGAERAHFTGRYRIIKLMSDVLPLLKTYIHGAGHEKL